MTGRWIPGHVTPDLIRGRDDDLMRPSFSRMAAVTVIKGFGSCAYCLLPGGSSIHGGPIPTVVSGNFPYVIIVVNVKTGYVSIHTLISVSRRSFNSE